MLTMTPALQLVALVLLLAVCTSAQFVSETGRKRPCPGASVNVGDTVHVHYSGYIDKTSATGKPDKLFDTSHKRKKPFIFKLGAGQVIRGWDQG
jgi:FKBP-type peptidyl-prolyl cis-trans isomerase